MYWFSVPVPLATSRSEVVDLRDDVLKDCSIRREQAESSDGIAAIGCLCPPPCRFGQGVAAVGVAAVVAGKFN
jgi:hypothetical protein